MPSFTSKLSDITPIKKGGQKQVYRAKHSAIGVVAYKTGRYDSVNTLERIKREVSFLKKTNSPNYPKNYDFEVDSARSCFHLLEEYIDGKTLSASMGNYHNESEIIKLLKDTVSALSLLWEENIVHRDLKPDNIMIKKTGEVVIIDLGIARFLDLDSLTASMALRGPCTPVYAAPEQLTNRKALIDKRCDFFALGIIALELYLGHHPFDPTKVGNNNNILENILLGKYVALQQSSMCSISFCQLASTLLAVQPYNRFKNHNVFSDFLSSNWS